MSRIARDPSWHPPRRRKSPRRVSDVSDDARRVRRPEGRPFSARRISSRPRRSAIRMVAELKLLVDSSSSLRSRGGTSLTDRYTWVFPPLAMKIVEVFTVTRCINSAPARQAFPLAFSLADPPRRRFRALPSIAAYCNVTSMNPSAAFESALSFL